MRVEAEIIAVQRGRGIQRGGTGRVEIETIRGRLARGLQVLVRVATVVAPIAFGVLMIRSARPASGPAEASFGTRPPPRPPVREASLQEGEGLAELLTRGGLGPREARRFLDLSRPYLDVSSPDPATTARFHGWTGSAPDRVELRIDRDRTLTFEVSGAVWEVTLDSVATYRDTVVVSGTVESSLWGARLGGDAPRLTVGQKGALPGHLAGVFAWQVDFYRDVRSGDAFKLALERDMRPDGSVRAERVLAAEWHTQVGTRLEAYRFWASDESGPLYYDAEGTSLRGAFLKAPLDLVRVTSRFSRDRYHPVLGGGRAHRGTDYGAASGTAVRATGDGTVRSAGWAGDYGLMIEIEHSGGIRTRYAHLSGIADRLVSGADVRQGEIIGTVGATGLASGPHLHYEFLLSGRAVDPASVDLPVERSVPEEDYESFSRERFGAGALLRRVSWPARETDR